MRLVGYLIWKPFVKSSENLWVAWNLSQAYSCKPSDIYSIHDELAAFFFDRAVHRFGSCVEMALDASSEGKSGNQAKAARTMTLRNWVGGEKQRFRDPAVQGR